MIEGARLELLNKPPRGAQRKSKGSPSRTTQPLPKFNSVSKVSDFSPIFCALEKL
jgi:hypothetical protein